MPGSSSRRGWRYRSPWQVHPAIVTGEVRLGLTSYLLLPGEQPVLAAHGAKAACKGF